MYKQYQLPYAYEALEPLDDGNTLFQASCGVY